MLTFPEIIEKIRVLKGLKNEGDVAQLLGFAQQTLSTQKKRGSIPFKELIAFCEKEGLSLDWLLMGKGNGREVSSVAPINEDLARDIIEGITEYLDSEELELPGEKMGELFVYLYNKLMSEKTEKSKVRGEVKALLKLVA